MPFTFYVQKNGSDITGNGSAEQPFATLEKARAAAAGKGTLKEPVRIHIEKGKYFLPQPLTLGAEDSFTEYIGPEAVLTGAMEFHDLRWQDYVPGIKAAEIAKGLPIDQLFINGRQMIMARYPDFDPAQPLQGSASQAEIRQRSRTWKHPETGYIRALHCYKWGGNSYKITGKNNSELGLSCVWAGDNNRGSQMHPDFIMAENILEELDQPGEWFYDKEAGKLYVYPLPDMELDNACVEGTVTEELIHIQGRENGDCAQHIVLDGLTLENTSRTLFTCPYVPLMRSDWCVARTGALFMQDAENIVFKNGTIRNTGGNGIFISGHADQIMIDQNEILHVGSSGIIAAGNPNSCREPSFWDETPVPEAAHPFIHKTTIEDTQAGPLAQLYPKNVFISNNHIYHVGIWEKQSSHVALSVAHHIAILHNTIHEGPRAGINVGDGTFGGHEIAYNDIFDVQQETDDHGMFNSWGRDRFWSLGKYDTMGMNGADKEPYSLLDVIDPIRIHDNRLHFGGRMDGGSTFGIDLDDGSSHYEIFNNLCLNMGIKLREGFHRRVYNNILVNAPFNLHCTFENSFDTVERNLVLHSNPYVLAATGEERFSVSRDRIQKNWFYNFGRAVHFPDFWSSLGYDSNSIFGDPLFADVSANDYTVTNQEQMDKIGFVNFDMHHFGQPGCSFRCPVYVISPDQQETFDAEREVLWGADICALNDAIMSSTGAGGLDGLYFENVPDNSLARRYGFQTHDVIKTLNGKKFGKKSNFILMYRELPEGSRVTVNIIRNQLPGQLEFQK